MSRISLVRETACKTVGAGSDSLARLQPPEANRMRQPLPKGEVSAFYSRRAGLTMLTLWTLSTDTVNGHGQRGPASAADYRRPKTRLPGALVSGLAKNWRMARVSSAVSRTPLPSRSSRWKASAAWAGLVP
jgi:hypothetical protein